jgi:transposase
MKKVLFEEYSLSEFAEHLGKYLKLHLQFKANEEEKILSKSETAKLFGVTTVTINNWVKNGWLTTSMMGGKPYFLKSEIIKKLKQQA